MGYDTSLNLKWLDPKVPSAKGMNFSLVNMCVFSAETADDRVVGLTVLEPRSLTAEFFSRILARQKNPEFSSCQLKLYAPVKFRHRIETLMAQAKTSVSIVCTPFINISHNSTHFSIRTRLSVVSVDDSPVLLKFLRFCMEEMGFVDILAQVSDSLTAADTIRKLKPDVVTMDIQMPNKNGVGVVKDLLESEYFPVLMISSLNIEEGSLVFDALNAGAFDYLQKPRLEEKEAFKKSLGEMMLLAIENKRAAANVKSKANIKRAAPKVARLQDAQYPENLIWCLGASTGGTLALTQVFTSLPTHVPPILVVQHIPPVFSKAFANSLNQLCPFEVKEAEHGEKVLPDHVYIACGGIQMGVEISDGALRIVLRDDPPVNRFKPSVDYLFNAVAKLKNKKIVAGLLTGMGRDGADGLLNLKNHGARTFAQDEATSAVYGMPRVAVEIGGAEQIVPLDQIAEILMSESANFRKAV